MSDPSPLPTSPSNPSGPAQSPLLQLSNEQLYRLLLTAVQGDQSAQNLASQHAVSAPQVNFLPFTAGPVLLSKSLLDAFPSLELTMLLDITKHKLCPMDLYKLDSKLHEKANDSGSTSSFLSHDSSTKDYPSLSALLTPLNLYFCILIYFTFSGGQADIVTTLSTSVLLYMDHLNNLNSCYEWPTVLQYHMEFHTLC
ncbi:hypothetical protein GYMLUDRAFT_57546 [Collybiopsis luxurians FD-317 M1]|uniref:Unplaced genomic scaffold GYMLUscaffold_16, whole genome shotgun sequence n=1 Tax=Collybiopsis luxurians FD-317 M1 TaxID=944289 RepID=A0A0D0CK92_9AGAR|nr:hypothetical protein GYMLUDRAFT_57546 [Collybiopsis luxurians FD-317 M1]